MPNQRISHGASAYFGMPIEAMMEGSTASVARGERRSRNGSSTPATPAMAKPSADTRSVATMSVEQLAARGQLDDPHARRRAAGRRTASPSVRAPNSQPSMSSAASTSRPPSTGHLRDATGAPETMASAQAGAGHCTSARMRS